MKRYTPRFLLVDRHGAGVSGLSSLEPFFLFPLERAPEQRIVWHLDTAHVDDSPTIVVLVFLSAHVASYR